MKRDAFTDPAFFGDKLHVQVATLAAWFSAVIDGTHEFTLEGARAFNAALDHVALECRGQEMKIAQLQAQVGHLQGQTGARAGQGGGAAHLGADKVVSLDAYRRHPLLPEQGGAA